MAAPLDAVTAIHNAFRCDMVSIDTAALDLARGKQGLTATVLPKSGFGRAIAYALDQWPGILRYTEIAEAELDNNGVESAIRPVALGRRNWMFAGSQSGGQRAAILFSLVTTCKRLAIDPQQYLTDVIARVGEHKLSRVSELTPRNWRSARA